MSTLVIEHFKTSELPQQWATRLNALPEQTVTVRIDTEDSQAAPPPETLVTDAPALGILRGREDMSVFVRQLRAIRFLRELKTDVNGDLQPRKSGGEEDFCPALS